MRANAQRDGRPANIGGVLCSTPQSLADAHYYTVSQKNVPTFTTCYNFYIHSSIATIFGIYVAKKVGN